MKWLLLVVAFSLISCKFFPKDPTPGVVVDRGEMPAGYKICLIGDSGKGNEGQYQVAKAMENYFAQLEGENVSNVYDFVLAEIEAPLLSMSPTSSICQCYDRVSCDCSLETASFDVNNNS